MPGPSLRYLRVARRQWPGGVRARSRGLGRGRCERERRPDHSLALAREPLPLRRSSVARIDSKQGSPVRIDPVKLGHYLRPYFVVATPLREVDFDPRFPATFSSTEAVSPFEGLQNPLLGCSPFAAKASRVKGDDIARHDRHGAVSLDVSLEPPRRWLAAEHLGDEARRR